MSERELRRIFALFIIAGIIGVFIDHFFKPALTKSITGKLGV